MKHPPTKYIANTRNTINAMRYKRVVSLKNVQKHLSAEMLQYIYINSLTLKVPVTAIDALRLRHFEAG